MIVLPTCPHFVTSSSPPPPPSYVYILDEVTGATGGFSVRKLRSSYSGSCLRVRRSSDNTEQDIGFDGNHLLDTSSLTSFVGANDGFVVTWYDQSGNGYSVGSATNSQQPRIVESGTLVTAIGGAPSLRFGVTSTDIRSTVTISSFISASNLTVFSVFKPSAIDTGTSAPYHYDCVFSSSNLYFGLHLFKTNVAGFYMWAGGSAKTAETSGISTGNSYIATCRKSSADGYSYNKINSTESSYAIAGDIDNVAGYLVLGNAPSGSSPTFSGYQSELLLFNTHLGSTDRTTIESNVNSYYGVY
jgi:hypothetical protein